MSVVLNRENPFKLINYVFFDCNIGTVVKDLDTSFPDYRFLQIPAQDIRTKHARPQTEETEGLLNSEGEVREEHKEPLKDLAVEANGYLQS